VKGQTVRWGQFVRGTVPQNVRITMQDYKSLHAAVTICATLVNMQTQTDFDRLY